MAEKTVQNPPEQKRKSYEVHHLEGGALEVTLKTGRKFVMQELTGLEQANADKMSGDSSMLAMIQTRVAMAITHIDGVSRLRGNNVEVMSTQKALRASEIDILTRVYQSEFTLTDEDLGNEFSLDASQPS
ncbi:MAG: hypothetical protein NVSMB31_13980 [Vulcanimicrobiaceae bacterium]